MQSLFVRNVCFHYYHTDGRSKTTWKCPANTEDRLHTLTRISFQLQVGRCSALGVTQISHLLFFFAFMHESPSTDKCQGCQEGQPNTHKHICTINLTSEWSRWRNLLCIHGDARWNIFPGFDRSCPVLSCPVLRTSGQQCNRRLGTRSTFSSSPYGQGHRLEINPRIHVFHRGEKLEQLGWKRKREILADRLNDLNPGTSSFQC